MRAPKTRAGAQSAFEAPKAPSALPVQWECDATLRMGWRPLRLSNADVIGKTISSGAKIHGPEYLHVPHLMFLLRLLVYR